MRKQTTICTLILFAMLTPIVLRGESIPEFQMGLLPVRKGEKWGFIDKAGKWAVSPEWDDVKPFNADGLAIVTKDKKLGFIDTGGKLVIANTWVEARHMSGGVVAVRDENRWGLLNKDGSTVVEPSWEVPPQVLDDGLFGFQVEYKNEKQGVIDSKGKIVAEPRYDHIWSFDHGLGKVNRDGKAGFVNRSGTEIIPLQYDYVSPFSEAGLATVTSGEKSGIINTSGKIIFKFEGDISMYKVQIKNGKADLAQALQTKEEWKAKIIGTSWEKVNAREARRMFTAEGKFSSDKKSNPTYEFTGYLTLSITWGDGFVVPCRLNEDCTEMVEVGGARGKWKRVNP